MGGHFETETGGLFHRNTHLALDALEQALYARPESDWLVHHSDRGVQYVSIRYTERLAEAGIESSVGSVGDSYDNALAETIIGLYKTEVIRRRGPWRNLEHVEFATLEWVDWFNHRRLLEPIGNIPPAEYEQQHYHQQETQSHGGLTQLTEPPENPGRFTIVHCAGDEEEMEGPVEDDGCGGCSQRGYVLAELRHWILFLHPGVRGINPVKCAPEFEPPIELIDGLREAVVSSPSWRRYHGQTNPSPKDV